MDPIHVLAEGLTNNFIDWVYVREKNVALHVTIRS